MIKKLLKWLLLIAAGYVIVVIGGLWGFYAYGLCALPSDTTPATEPMPTMVTLQALWISETKTTSMVMDPLSPTKWVRAIIGEGLDPFPSGRVASCAARLLLSRELELKPGLSRQIKWSAASIWVSRNWKAEEALATILNESYFGHGFNGIEEAARGYFDLPVETLSISEAAIIAGLVRSPSAHDPWCHPKRAQAFAQDLVVKMDPSAKFSPRLLPVPDGACKK